ncbi:MAG: GAF domain-containing sensor histidine kinase [Xenococcaceae cyanobacterium MO_234.B1]|nr:GAF domain-containing sensor histidine kinase [Xenococcaceae cyanobacterium MO_234.B1]
MANYFNFPTLNNLSSSIEQRYLAEKMQHIEQQILRLISRSNSSTLVKQLASTLGELFHADGCGIISGNIDQINNLEINWWGNGAFSNVELEVLEKFFTQLLRENSAAVEPTLTNDTTPETLETSGKFLPQISSLHIITSFQGKANGAVVLLKSQSYQWTNSEIQLLAKISDSMAIALSQVQLQQIARNKTQYHNLLSRITQAIGQSSEIEALFQLSLSEIGQVLQVNRSKVLTLKYQDPLFAQRRPSVPRLEKAGRADDRIPRSQKSIKATVNIAYQWSDSAPESSSSETVSFQLTDSVWCQKALAQAPEALIVNEGASFPDFLPENSQGESASALLIVPLMGTATRDSQSALVLGFLVLERDHPHSWTEDEIDLVSWMGVQLSVALIHHQTLTQVQSLVDERTAQLKWSLEVQAKLSEKMRRQIQQLRQLNELKDDFLNSMSHELKTPLTSMKMAIQMLRQPIPEVMREKYLNILEQEWNREYNLIKDLLTLQQVESGELSFTPQELNLNQIIQELEVAFKEKWHSSKGLHLDTELSDPDLTLYSDSDSLNHVLNELLVNAGKYSDPDTTVKITATNHITFQGKEIEISLTNYGAGITQEELPFIFDKFRRGKGVTDRAVPGTGLGLSLVKHLVEHLNGEILVTSEPIEEDSEVFQTAFTLKLPSVSKPLQ